MIQEVIQAAILFVLGGGVFKSYSSIKDSQTLAKKNKSDTDSSQAKLPVEIDSLAIQGSERALVMMGQALDVATEQIEQLTTDRDEDRALIRELKEDRERDRAVIQELREEVATLHGELNSLRDRQDDREAGTTS